MLSRRRKNTKALAVYGRSRLLPGEISPDAPKGDAVGRSEQSAEAVGAAGRPSERNSSRTPISRSR
jgi:hypothetical protein